ncbi:MAG: hypothetical protein WCK47_14815, partial [bacterium]
MMCCLIFGMTGAWVCAADEAAQPAAQKVANSSASQGADGLSKGERISRLLVEARGAYQNGNIDSARAKFDAVLTIDASNPEARKFLTEIDRARGAQRFAVGADTAGGKDGGQKTAATPAPQPEPDAGEKAVAQSAVTSGAPDSVKAVQTASQDAEQPVVSNGSSGSEAPEAAKIQSQADSEKSAADIRKA